MNKLIVILAVLVAGCSTLRDRAAEFIESDARATRPDRVRIETEYLTVPEEYLECPPPVSLTPQEIARITSEGDYNELFVAPLYANNETCYLNMQRIERFNESVEQEETGEKQNVQPTPSG